MHLCLDYASISWRPAKLAGVPILISEALSHTLMSCTTWTMYFTCSYVGLDRYHAAARHRTEALQVAADSNARARAHSLKRCSSRQQGLKRGKGQLWLSFRLCTKAWHMCWMRQNPPVRPRRHVIEPMQPPFSPP